MNYVEGFSIFATGVGCAPASGEQIIADDKLRYFTIEGHKPNSKKGAYQLKNNDDYTVGWVRNFKEGETHTYTSKSSKEWTVEEKTEWKRKVDDAKKSQAKELTERRQAAKVKAKEIWDNAAKQGNHPYLTRKKIELNGARISNGKLIIPVYKDGALVSLQTISSDGDKYFLEGGEISGGWFPLAHKDDDKTTLIIAEGFASSASIRKAINFPVIVAFSACNLKSVAIAIRSKYPDAKIILAADNDIPSGIGYEKALQAAAAIKGGFVILPEAIDNESTDFSNIYLAQGEEAVKGYFIKPTETPPEDEIPNWTDEMPPLEAYGEEEAKTVALYAAGEEKDDNKWLEKLDYKKDGKLQPRSLANAQLFIEHDKILGNLFCYDEFCHEKVLYRCPPWEKPDKFKPRTICDEDITHLNVALESKGLQHPFGNITRLLESVIKKILAIQRMNILITFNGMG